MERLDSLPFGAARHSRLQAAAGETTIVYDKLGRRTQLVNLDAGTTDFFYDAMGNLVRKQDSNLRSRIGSPSIRYEYDLDQLVGIRYPEGSATMDVKFEYGPPGVRADNGAGRIVRVVDDAGEETRAYGNLGELVQTTRTLRPLKPLEAPMVFTTRFDFDEYGRMNWIQYPDGETVRYEYDQGGLLRSARGDRPATFHYPAASEQYLQLMTYDEFGQRRLVKLGNGAVTKYGYYPENHRLKGLQTVAANRTLQNLGYGYDRVGNVTFESNGLGAPTESRSGDVAYEFQYDSLDRLRWAKGTAAARPGVTDEFQTDYAYSNIHDMTSNKQVHKVTTVTDLGSEAAFPPHTNHDFTYTYGGAGPHQATQIGETFLTYDGNGNTRSECRDHADPTCSVNHDHYRSYQWTEDNRLASVIDGGGKSITRFVYDAAGERVVKYGSGGASITVGQFFNVKGRTAATKHIFAGTARLASKLLPPGDFSSPVLGSPLATTVVTTTTSSSTTQVGGGLPNDTGCVPSDYQPQKCPILVNGEPVVPYPFQDTKVRPETYYYHPDHLGSTSWVTDQNGKVHEHVDYFPYGEIWREPKSDRDGAGVKGQRFLFSGKELDEETGLYYFGARYYDPVRVRWASTDPLLGAYVPQEPTAALPAGGAFITVNLSLYHYARWSPTRYVDSDGREWGEAAWNGLKDVTDFAGGLALGFVEGSTLPLAPMEFGTEKYSQGRGLGMKLGGVLDMFVGAVMATGGVLTGPGEAVMAPAGAAVAAKGVASYAFAMSVKPGSQGGGSAQAGSGKKNDPEQSALIDMAKRDKKTGITPADAKAYKELGKESNVPVRGPEVHPNRPQGKEPHVHVGPVDHIPVKKN